MTSNRDIANAIVDRLVDNYEGKGDDIHAFYRLSELLGNAIADSEDFAEFEHLADTLGVLESDYFN